MLYCIVMLNFDKTHRTADYSSRLTVKKIYINKNRNKDLYRQSNILSIVHYDKPEEDVVVCQSYEERRRVHSEVCD